MINKIPTIAELSTIHWNDNGEDLVDLADVSSNIICSYRRVESGLNAILVRQTIAEMLQKVQWRLQKISADFQLLVVDGYRSLEYQERYYLQQLLTEYQLYPNLAFDILLEHTHQYVALPTVAGHPTGGAVDLSIAKDGKELDFGGVIADFSNPDTLPMFSPHISVDQARNRRLLHDLMCDEGFAPFYGEWWHYSYGEREWAVHYAKPEAFYAPVT